VLLVKQASRGPVNKAEFEKQCQLMAQRTAILNGSSDVNTNDQAFFSAYFLQLEELGYIKKDANLTLSLCPNMEELAESSMMLLSEDLRQSISRMATGQVQLSASSSNSFRPV
jgi:glycerol-3-phosphate O-acyltransferase